MSSDGFRISRLSPDYAGAQVPVAKLRIHIKDKKKKDEMGVHICRAIESLRRAIDVLIEEC